MREFRDSSGQLGRAWPVAPAQLRHGKSTERYVGDFHNGRICFEALESTARRRVSGRPPVGQSTEWIAGDFFRQLLITNTLDVGRFREFSSLSTPVALGSTYQIRYGPPEVGSSDYGRARAEGS